MEKKDFFNKAILTAIAVGIWMLVLQNFNVFDNRKDVYVRGGYINADVSGRVSVGNTVDINISAINGYSNAFYDHTFKHPGRHYRLPVYTGQ